MHIRVYIWKSNRDPYGILPKAHFTVNSYTLLYQKSLNFQQCLWIIFFNMILIKRHTVTLFI